MVTKRQIAARESMKKSWWGWNKAADKHSVSPTARRHGVTTQDVRSYEKEKRDEVSWGGVDPDFDAL